MRFLQRAWSEIKQGENIDLYLIVLAAFLVGAISLLGVTTGNLTASVTLAILGLIAIATIKNRHEFEQAVRSLIELKGNARAVDFFLTDKKISEQSFSSANTIFLLGMTLGRTTREYMYVLGERLIAGAKIRIVILDPTMDALLEQLTLRSSGKTSIEYWRSRLETIKTVIRVIAETPNAKGILEVGYLPYIPSFGFIMIEPDERNGVCFVELYHHKSAKPNPTFCLHVGSDPDWYKFFREQFEILWMSCRIEVFNTNIALVAKSGQESKAAEH